MSKFIFKGAKQPHLAHLSWDNPMQEVWVPSRRALQVTLIIQEKKAAQKQV